MPDLPIDLKDIVTESLKSVSSPLIDAWLGPKIRQWKADSERRDLEQRRLSDETAQVFDDYVRRVMQKVSGVTTVLAPERPFKITDIYEPISLRFVASNDRWRPSTKPNTEGSLGFLWVASFHSVIIDSAGMGKSTFVKYLTLQVIQRTESIPIFFELRRLSETDTVLSKMMQDIDGGAGVLDERLFLQILKQGGFKIILDGFDEILDSRKSAIAEQITQLSQYSDENRIILTSRPESLIPELHEVMVFECTPFSKNQAIAAVRKMDALLGLESGERLIERFDAVPPFFLEVPLLLTLLYRTYTHSQNIPNKISAFYNDLYDAFYRGHDLTKAGFIREKRSSLDLADFRKLLGAMALLMLIKEKNTIASTHDAQLLIRKAIELSGITPATPEFFFDDLRHSVPFLIRDGIEHRFIHKTLIEFFSADYLVSSIHHQKNIRKMLTSGQYDRFASMFLFLSELSREVFNEYVLRHFLELIFRLADKGINPRLITLLLMSDLYVGLVEFPEEEAYDHPSDVPDEVFDDGGPDGVADEEFEDDDDEDFFVSQEFVERLPANLLHGKMYTDIVINVTFQQRAYKFVCVSIGYARQMPKVIWDAIIDTTPFDVSTLSDTSIDLGDVSLLSHQFYQWGIYHPDTPWADLRNLSKNDAFIDRFTGLLSNKGFLWIYEDGATLHSVSLEKCRAAYQVLDQAKNNADLLNEFFTT